MNKRHNRRSYSFAPCFFSLLYSVFPFNSSSNNSSSPCYYFSSTSSSYSSDPPPTFILSIRLPYLSLCFSFSSFPMTLLLPFILLSQFQFVFFWPSTFVLFSLSPLLTFSPSTSQPHFLSRITFVHRFTNPFDKSVVLRKDTAKPICWKIQTSKQLFPSISRTNSFISSLMTFIMCCDNERVKIVKDFCLDTPRHLRH